MTEGHINPLQWNWTRWPFDFDLGSVLNPEPLIATIKAMWYSIPSLVGGDDAEGRLRHAADAHELMAAKLDKIFDVLDTRTQGQSDGYMDRIIKEWKGKAADEFRKVWGEVVKHENRQAVATSATGIAKILRAVADSSAMTKTALIELLKAAAIWAGVFMALRWIARTWGGVIAAQMATYAAYLRTTRLVGMALQVLIRFLSMLRTCALALRNLPVVGRLLLRMPGAAKLRSLKAAAAMSRVEVELAKFTKYAGYAEKAGKTSFSSFAKTSGWVYTGVIGSQMLSQGMQGNSIFNLDPLTFAQAARITTGATLAATFAPLSGLSTKGLASGGTAGSFTAPLTKSGQAVVESGEAFGGFVALRNPAYEALKKKLPTIGGRGNGHKTFYQALPTAVFRVWRPLHTTEKPEELPQWQQPSTGEQTLKEPPRVQTAKVGYWPVNGDLETIAQKVYGDANRWREIYDANRDAIGPDPRNLRPGQILRIPLDD
ncbi:hypothetical protein HTZ77_02065 [Nonomuraea sp. SMC257]|uniref:LysM peptidoglycan-binding domain-containing protein n=1 Tax=Nonomuraea montanisoli TaxID=2741721 RepID=A0A7Y6I301_9ACTN|nr:hypothetical protein [Nonomuraea montanisoli]NUW30218.1 hypothetical protein [Nonomuraea montanisoli]